MLKKIPLMLLVKFLVTIDEQYSNLYYD